ncbi:ubiquitin-like domain-containing protein [Streptomyces phaeoluteigriseus]
MSNLHHLRDAQYAQHPEPLAHGADDTYADDTYVDVHNAETLAYGVYAPPWEQGTPVVGTAYEDTYRPAYEPREPRELREPREAAETYGAYEPGGTQGTQGTQGTHEPALPRQAHAGDEAVGGRAARRRRSRESERSDSPMRRLLPLFPLLPQALVVAFLAGGTTAFVAKDKAIELTVDGKPRTLHTFADDVSELLAEEGVRVGAHDMVAPAPGTALGNGDEIAVRYGRPVRLVLDGERREVWTTAHTVEEALRQLGVRAEGAYLSVSRSRRIGREGLALDVRTERAVTIMADGRARIVRTNAATVREAVEEAGITLRGQDTTSVAPGSFPRDGQTITVLRITGGKEVREDAIPFLVRRTEDPTLFRGTEVVERAGQPGLLRVTYALRTVNGVRQRPRRVRTEIVREPRAQVVKVGTKPRPASVRGADHLDWQALAVCESGGRPDAVDPSGNYGGLYQFDTHTWHSLGGTGRPQDASASEQTFRAKKLYTRRGTAPWPHCGPRLQN